MAKSIKLTQGKVAIVDDEDFEWLSQWKWHVNKGLYAVRSVKNPGSTVSMHREILGVEKGVNVDHKNEDGEIGGFNNQRYNLRICNQSQNGANSRLSKNNTSGVSGVSWVKKLSVWRVYLMVNRKQIFFGHYKDLKVATKIRNEKAKELFGDFARTYDV